MTKEDQEFADYMTKVDSIIQKTTGGLTHEDLIDANYREYHESGMSPEETAQEVLSENGFDEDCIGC